MLPLLWSLSYYLSTVIQFLYIVISASVQTMYDKKLNVLYSFLSILRITLDFFIISSAAGFSLYKGFSGACRRPVDYKAVFWYKGTQSIQCVFWLTFSITRAGCFYGWTRIAKLSDHDEGAAKFCIFLAVIQSLGYTVAMILGMVGIVQISSVLYLFIVDD